MSSIIKVEKRGRPRLYPQLSAEENAKLLSNKSSMKYYHNNDIGSRKRNERIENYVKSLMNMKELTKEKKFEPSRSLMIHMTKFFKQLNEELNNVTHDSQDL